MRPFLLIPWATWFLMAFTVVSGGYAPSSVVCPVNQSLTREADSISIQEKAWLTERQKKTDEAIRDYLKRVNVNYTVDMFDSGNGNRKPITIAMAFSGGGLRAMFTAAGQIAALDNRTANAKESGLGGILQSSSYVAGLSGGSWAFGSFIFQNWPTIDEVVFENPYKIWDYGSLSTFVNTPRLLSLAYALVTNNYEKVLTHISGWNMPPNEGIGADMAQKQDAGFPVSITDAWGRILARLFFPKGSNNWLDSATWSGIRETRMFAKHIMPLPIVTALARRPGSLDYNLNSPIVEFNPFEMGSFDTSIKTFHDIKYLGTPVYDGVPKGDCKAGFDNAAFTVGTSSSIFNQLLNTLVCPDCRLLHWVLKYFVRKFLEKMSKNRQDIAWYKPNPFYASRHAKSDKMFKSETLYLMDGGLAGEIVPLSTISVKERALDLVFSFDNDGPEWPQGTSLINTYKRQFLYEGASTVFPHVPGQSTFTYYNLTAKPTFFGCDAGNLTALVKDGVVPPIVAYIANRPYEFYSNMSTWKVTYSDNEKKGMVTNGFDIVSQGNRTKYAGPNWQTCVGCAMVRRAEERNNVAQSEACQKCFAHYCWDGKLHEDASYKAPVNFTDEGLTNEPMSLDMHNAYIHEKTKPLSLLIMFLSLFE